MGKKNIGIILAAGTGARIKSTTVPKQFIKIAGHPIIIHTIQRFLQCPSINEILLVVPRSRIKYAQNLLRRYKLNKKIYIIQGGKTRQDSAYNALSFLSKKGDINVAVIHDAVRPFVTPEVIEKSVAEAKIYGAANVAAKTADTIIEIEDGFIKSILDRAKLYNSQTPQTFKFKIIWEAHKKAKKEKFSETTDDVRLVLRQGHKVKLIESPPENIKITTALDLETAKILIKNLLKRK